MDIKEIEKVVASVQHAVFKNANSMSAGALRSRFRGAGLQFREHQIYTHGDDVRFIDWKVSARSSHVYLKTFEEDRNVEITVMLDIGPSSFYGSRGVTKLQMALELTALLYLLAQETHDQIRTVFLYAGGRSELPPKKGREGLILFIAHLEKLGILANGKVNLQKQYGLSANQSGFVLSEIKRQLAKKKEVIYFGDMSNLSVNEEATRMLVDGRFHGMRLLSPLDSQSLPFSFSTSLGKLSGLGRPRQQAGFFSRFPTLTSSERYLELFLRRIK
jgi:uncharacterized protein (DUF58 family)